MTELPKLVEKCPRCYAHWRSQSQGLLNAFASVGIEHGKSSWEMAESYFMAFHRGGHKTV